MLSPAAPDTAINLTGSAAFEVDPALSPDDMTIAFVESGAIHVAEITQPWSLGPRRVLLDSTASLRFPAWRPVP